MKNLLDYIPNAKHKTGEEYSSPCPLCGGNDRFIIFADKNRYMCRQCQAKGDLIQYLRDVHNLSYKDACLEIGRDVAHKPFFAGQKEAVKADNAHKQKNIVLNRNAWQEQATRLIDECKNNLIAIEDAQHFISFKRHIVANTAFKAGLAWNDKDRYFSSNIWGVDSDKKLFIPRGLIIATRRKTGVLALAVRTVDNDRPKYWQIKGSEKIPYIIGNTADIIFIMESGLDAILLYQESFRIGVNITCIALNGATKKLDDATINFIQRAKQIFVVADNDDAGLKAVHEQLSIFPFARAFTAGNNAKDLGELASKAGNSSKVADWLATVLKVNNIDNSCDKCVHWNNTSNIYNMPYECNISKQTTARDWVCSCFEVKRC